MAFPQTPLQVLVELMLNGTWTDITPDVYTAEKIVITRGRADEGQRVDPGKCTLTLNNRLGKYSPRNPVGPYYGQIGRNTPVRVSVKAGTGFLELPGVSGAGATTADAAPLDITGDIDVRLDATLNTWPGQSVQRELCGKWEVTGGQRSWLLLLWTDGTLLFNWSADGTTVLTRQSTTGIVVPPSRRLAVRATLDVNDGAGNHVVTFYTAPTMAGPWTQLGAPVTTAGVTSIFNSTAPVTVGDLPSITAEPPTGRAQSFELRSGIGGSVVANPDFTAQTVGASSFADGAGRTWTMVGGATLSNRRTRFVGEISSWPSRWDVSGKDVRVPVEAAGILRRLGQGQKALDSTLRRRLPSYSPVAYWPMEEGKQAEQVASPVAGVRSFNPTGFDFASDDSLPGSAALPAIASSASFTAVVPPATDGTWHMELVYNLETMPGSLTPMFEVLATGTARRVRVRVATNNVVFEGFDDDGTSLFSNSITAPLFTGAWNRLQIRAIPSGGNVIYSVRWIIIGGTGFVSTATIAATAGHVTQVRSTFGSGLSGLRFGHLAVFSSSSDTPFNSADQGFSGETAGTRIARLAAEESLPIVVPGDSSLDEQVGPQRLDTVVSVLESAAEVDGGILYEHREAIGLVYRNRESLENQTVALALDYTAPGHIAPPLEPVDDDQEVRNDVTVTRDGGSSGRTVLDTGTLSTQAPPNGVGVYDESVTLNLWLDAQAVQHAGWRLHLGTWDEARYPVLRMDLAAAPSLIDAVTQLDSGDRVTIANPPAWLPPGPIDLLAQGYTETIGHPIDWDVEVNCTPAGPWTVAVYDTVRRDTSGSQLAAAAASGATALSVVTTEGARWSTDAGDVPFDVLIGGEQIAVTGVASFLRDTFTRTVANSWGSPDTGPAWNTVGGGPSSDYSVGSGFGAQVLSTLDVSRRTAVTAVHGDFDIYCDITTSALATGDSLYGAVTARMLDASNMYLARLEFTTGNAVILSVRKIIADVQTQLGAFTVPVTHVAGTFIRVRFQGRGSVLQAKAWPATAMEPHRWHISATDTAITAANQIGTRSIRSTGNTNAATVAIRYDNFDVVNPQVFTATRSANGIVKAQAVGAAIQLAQPAIRAL